MKILQTNQLHYKNSKLRSNNTNNVHFRDLSFGIRLKHVNEINTLKQANKLVIIAHPDDETCFFGFIAKFLKNPKESIQLVYTTSGQKGQDIRNIIPRYDKKMQFQREKELSEALDELNVKQ